MIDDSYKLDFIEVRVPDMMNLVEVIGLALGLHQAEDIAKCHRNLVEVRYSPLTSELESVRDRFDGLVKDYWAERGRAQAAEAMTEVDQGEAPEEVEVPEPLGASIGSRKAPPLVFEKAVDVEGETDE